MHSATDVTGGYAEVCRKPGFSLLLRSTRIGSPSPDVCATGHCSQPFATLKLVDSCGVSRIATASRDEAAKSLR